MGKRQFSMGDIIVVMDRQPWRAFGFAGRIGEVVRYYAKVSGFGASYRVRRGPRSFMTLRAHEMEKLGSVHDG